MSTYLFLANLVSTLAMAGAIWIVQVVHYPLFARVGGDGFAAYEVEHASRITYVVAPLMLAELATSALLLWVRPAGMPREAVWVGLGLVGAVWVSTFALQVPLHSALARGFDAKAHSALVLTNWVRTAAWTARGLLLVWVAARTMG